MRGWCIWRCKKFVEDAPGARNAAMEGRKVAERNPGVSNVTVEVKETAGHHHDVKMRKYRQR